MADHRDYFRQVAAECWRLAEIANKPEIKQRLLNMAAEYQAKADEHSNEANGAGTGPRLALDAGDGVARSMGYSCA